MNEYLKAETSILNAQTSYSEQMGSVYLVKLDLENTNPDIRVMSGLSGTVEVKVSKQSVMHYFLDPIMKGFGESLREN